MNEEIPSAVDEAASDIVSAAVVDAGQAAEAADQAAVAAHEAEAAAARLIEAERVRADDEIAHERARAHEHSAETIADNEERVLSLENRLDAQAQEMALLREELQGMRLAMEISSQAPMTSTPTTETPEPTPPPQEETPEALHDAGADLPVAKPERKKHRFL